jgi:hypothetical protein
MELNKRGSPTDYEEEGKPASRSRRTIGGKGYGCSTCPTKTAGQTSTAGVKSINDHNEEETNQLNAVQEEDAKAWQDSSTPTPAKRRFSYIISPTLGPR